MPSLYPARTATGGNREPSRSVLRYCLPTDPDFFVSFEHPGTLPATERFVEATAHFGTRPYVKWRELGIVEGRHF